MLQTCFLLCHRDADGFGVNADAVVGDDGGGEGDGVDVGDDG